MSNNWISHLAGFTTGAGLSCALAVLQQALLGIPMSASGYLAFLSIGGLAGVFLNKWRRNHNRTHRDLAASEERFRQLYQKTPVMLHSIDGEGRLVTVSDLWLDTLGYTRSEVIGRRLTSFMTENSRALAEQTTLPRFFKTGSLKDVPYKLLRKNGDILDIRLSAVAEKDSNGRFLRSLAVAADVTESKKAEEEIQQLAYFDTLTGLPNRTLFIDRLRHALAHGHREHTKIAVLFLDLDQFKGINDTLGHAAGDRFLQIVAQRLRDCVREGDTVARLGGDEFVFVISDFDGEQELTAFAKRILHVLAQPARLEEGELFSTASIGIAVYPLDGADVGHLLRNADIAMYEAKAKGRNTYQFFSEEMNDRAVEKINLENSLRNALQRNELFLAYQPQLDLQTGQVIGMEALLRWRHPTQGMIPPEKFIPVAEETGLIIPIGEWVLQTACRQAQTWRDQGYPPWRMSVNVSGRQFKQPNFIDQLEKILQDTGLDPNGLEIELTESIVMENIQDAIMTLTDLKVRNIYLSIDDFGTGYSSLVYLKHFPIDRIKIAQEFVRDIPGDADDSAIVEAIIAMAHSLNLKVIAEGVEREEQLTFLHDRRCTEMQGFYFAHPMPCEALPGYFAKGGSTTSRGIIHH